MSCDGDRRGNQVIYIRLNPLVMIILLRLDMDKKTWKSGRSGESLRSVDIVGNRAGQVPVLSLQHIQVQWLVY